jgi:polyhydroxybutyrate depolymerase
MPSRPPTLLLRRLAWIVAGVLLTLGACAPGSFAERGLPAAHAAPAPNPSLAPDPSPGCSRQEALPSVGTVTVAGQDRHYLLHLPAEPTSTPRALILAFHGRTGSASGVRAYFGLEAVLPDAVIAYPEALPRSGGGSAWHDDGDPVTAQRDFALVAALVESIGAATCLDGNRLFVVGHSLGAYFANDLACFLGDRLRGVVSVAGGMQLQRCVGASAALLLHHPLDPLVPVSAGERARDAFRRANGHTAPNPERATLPALAALGCLRYGLEVDPHPVYWCAVERTPISFGRPDPHAWPAGSAAAIASFVRSLP